MDYLPHMREEYGDRPLLEEDMHADPLVQFQQWFERHAQTDSKTPNAMVLSTVDEHHQPDSRVVLLKELDKDAFIFYTQYNSVKGLQLESNPFVALNFYWPQEVRQVRVRGKVHKVPAQQSDSYFYSRPMESQLSAMAARQSAEIAGRDALDAAYDSVSREYADKRIIRPDTWGGYAVTAQQIEFWQGRDSRLHDRIQYLRQAEGWRRHRLAP